MKLQKIKHFITLYTAELQTISHYKEAFKWECLKNFKVHWEDEAIDFLARYDASFASRYSSSLWSGSKYSPKAAMLDMIESDPSFCKTMFRNLFDERKDITLRINRFKHHCNEVFSTIATALKSSGHQHDDNKMCSLYLAFRYPDKYAILEYDHLVIALKRFEMVNPPAEYEIERCFKITRALGKILSNDESLLKVIKNKIQGPEYDHEPSLMLVYDFYLWVSKH